MKRKKMRGYNFKSSNSEDATFFSIQYDENGCLHLYWYKNFIVTSDEFGVALRKLEQDAQWNSLKILKQRIGKSETRHGYYTLNQKLLQTLGISTPSCPIGILTIKAHYVSKFIDVSIRVQGPYEWIRGYAQQLPPLEKDHDLLDPRLTLFSF